MLIFQVLDGGKVPLTEAWEGPALLTISVLEPEGLSNGNGGRDTLRGHLDTLNERDTLKPDC